MARPKTQRKIRSDSIIFSLPEEVQEDMFNRLKTGGNTAEDVAEYLINEGIVKSITPRAVRYFRGTYEDMKDRKEAMVKARTVVLNVLEWEGIDLSGKTHATKLDDFMLLTSVSEGDSEKYVAISKLRIARQQLEIDRRKVMVMEQKAGLFDKAKNIAASAELSQDEKNAALANILK